MVVEGVSSAKEMVETISTEAVPLDMQEWAGVVSRLPYADYVTFKGLEGWSSLTFNAVKFFSKLDERQRRLFFSVADSERLLTKVRCAVKRSEEMNA